MNVPVLILFIVLYSTKEIECANEQIIADNVLQTQEYYLSDKIKNIDGIYINADSIECFRKFRQWILNTMQGKLNAENELVGMYPFNDTQHTIRSLAQYEYELTNNSTAEKKEYEQELYVLLEKIKDDLITKAQIFISRSHTSIHIIYELIHQECQKRNIAENLLTEWASSPIDEKIALIKYNIPTFASLLQFNIDLLQFLTNVIHNCPVANKQLTLRIAKWEKINELLPKVFESCNVIPEEIDSADFLRYIKLHDLDLLTISEITKEQLIVILYAYQKRIYGNEHKKTD